MFSVDGVTEEETTDATGVMKGSSAAERQMEVVTG